MSLNFRFAIVSDPHIALPHTIWDHPSRFHLVEVSIPALEVVLERLAVQNLDFLLLPGDLTQHGEPENHIWLAKRLAQLPYPVYVIPGNHDVLTHYPTDRSIGLKDFPLYYQSFGYKNPDQLYYAHEILPGVQLIGLNSNHFDAEGNQTGTGYLDQVQIDWLKQTLQQKQAEIVLVMVHHNVIEHLPGQAKSSMGQRYMLSNAAELLQILQEHCVQLLFTGHLHVQDVSHYQGVYEITTGSLVSYPHPYRILEFQKTADGNYQLQIDSERVGSVPGWSDLLNTSREWMGDRSFSFMLKFLTQPPLNLSISEAEKLAPALRYFWADIANGDAVFHFPHLSPEINRYLKKFSAVNEQGDPQLIDNCVTLQL
ncbi:MAG: metallophosphoesterase [Elainellaceae cyanobacterium]